MFSKPCPYCRSKALVYMGATRTLMATLPPETDDEGNIILHEDPNITTEMYLCKKCGHQFEVKL